MTAPHPIHRRLLAEQLTQRRRAREQERYATSQRRGRIDLNPHQVDAAVFALERIREGGCILADEVGLGKTIEAGLVIAQLIAEGIERILIIVPKPLLGQWQNELYDLFGIAARADASFDGPGVFLIGREFAGSERGSEMLRQCAPFGLCVIDEAHEIFAGIHKRYDRSGHYRDKSKHAILADRVRAVLRDTPKLLLTATPIQNSLVELWGLVQYVEPTGTLLGNLATFRELFCAGDDRTLVPDQAEELRRRLASVVKRTLRRQAQEFLERPFVKRQAKLYEYRMSPDERALYEDVTRYLLDSDSCAFAGGRQFLLIGFHRRMASSRPALAASLEKVAQRLERMLQATEKLTAGRLNDVGVEAEIGAQIELAFGDDADFFEELRDETDDYLNDSPATTSHHDMARTVTPLFDPDKLRAELAQVNDYIHRAKTIPDDSKASMLLKVITALMNRARLGKGSGKVVIFTESLVTQDYLRARLIAHGIPDAEITLFRGQNDSPRTREALHRWQEECDIPEQRRPSMDIAMRLALVYEFETRSRIFIATEAGAKGLNLQVCDTVVNYDLPWNPQRIEQRIGRCHRYNQIHDVTVINFVAKDNEAERLLFDILTTKLDLFGTVFDASDAVLHQPANTTSEPLTSALGASIDLRIRRIYERARSMDEIHSEMASLRNEVDRERKAFDEVMTRTRGLIESRFDDRVREVFLQIRDELPRSLAKLDRNIDILVSGFLKAAEIPYERVERGDAIVLTIGPAASLPVDLQNGTTVTLGQASNREEPLYIGHPLVAAAVAEARQASDKPFTVSFLLDDGTASEFEQYRGRRGRLMVAKISSGGYEPIDSLITMAVLEASQNCPEQAAYDMPTNNDGELLSAVLAQALLGLPTHDIPPLAPPLRIAAETLDDALEEAIFLNQSELEEAEHQHFERMLRQIECFIDDRLHVLGRRRSALLTRIAEAEDKRDAALGSDRRGAAERALLDLHTQLEVLDVDIARLTARDDPEYQRWRTLAHERRYAPPKRQIILDVQFILDWRGVA